MNRSLAAGMALAAALLGGAAGGEESPSLYDLAVPLVDQDGKSAGLDDFKGKPVLVSMFYASCPQACPLLISNLKALERQLEPAERGELRVLLVSLDPERDTPEVLHRLMESHGVDASRWRLARASADGVRELSAALRIKYRQRSDGSINHTSEITVLDRGGHVLGRIDGQQAPPDEAVRMVAALARGD